MGSKCRSHRAEQIEITLWRTGIGGEGLGEPWVLVAAVVRHQVDQHPQAAVVRPCDELVGLLEGAELRQDVAVVGDVVPAVSQRRGIPGAHPDRIQDRSGKRRLGATTRGLGWKAFRQRSGRVKP
jgi:hypothetical protein